VLWRRVGAAGRRGLRGSLPARGDPPETIFLGLMRLQVGDLLRYLPRSIHRFRPRLNSNLNLTSGGQAANLPASPRGTCG